jgi:DUF4097 and DUF4098 domain-containing protein YvlB
LFAGPNSPGNAFVFTSVKPDIGDVMKTSRILFTSVFAVMGLVTAGSIVRAEKTFVIEQSRSRAAAPQTSPDRNSDDWCREDRYNSGRDRYERSCDVRTVTIPAPATLDVETSNGSIAVTGSSRRDVTVQTKIMAQAETESEAKALVADVKIITDRGTIRAEGPRTTGRRSWWVSYRIETPERQNVNLGSSNGSVTLTGLDGVLRAETSNGSVHATELSGDVKLSTSNGSVQVALSGSSWAGAGLEATTSNGSLRVDMPRDYNARLIARTSNGSLNVDRPITMQGRIGREIDTTIGRGGPAVRFHTSNGSLTIRER